jgi:hypothetical protein
MLVIDISSTIPQKVGADDADSTFTLKIFTLHHEYLTVHEVENIVSPPCPPSPLSLFPLHE